MSNSRPFQGNTPNSNRRRPQEHSDTPRRPGSGRPASGRSGPRKSQKDFGPEKFGSGYSHPQEFTQEDPMNDAPATDSPLDTDERLAPHPKMAGAIDALISLDLDLMKLLVRRAKLLSRVREGREHASSPKAIVAEKQIRKAWEKNAPAFSKDPRFARQLFGLLQEVSVLEKGAAPKDSFRLSPSRKAVTGAIAGPVLTGMAQCWIALAAVKGQGITLVDVPLTSSLMDCVKTFTQAGAEILIEPSGHSLGKITVKAGSPISFSGKTIYVGESPLTLYLVAFIAAKEPGTCRLTGGNLLKGADLSPLRQVLPLLGARLANVIPHSQGLPANIECSGVLPQGVTVPGNLCLDAVVALFLAHIFWDIPFSYNLQNLSATLATTAIARAGAILQQTGGAVEENAPLFRVTPGTSHLPATPSLYLDPVLTAYLLAIPAFTNGEITLFGSWPQHTPDSHVALSLLQWAGLQVEVHPSHVKAVKVAEACTAPLTSLTVSPHFSPLFFALTALGASAQKSIERPAHIYFDVDEDEAIADEMLQRAGFMTQELRITPAEDARESVNTPWASPDAYWGMGFALCSFIQPGLKLINPRDVTAIHPVFWPLFNNLPDVALSDDTHTPRTARKEPNDKQDPPRRRIIAD